MKTKVLFEDVCKEGKPCSFLDDRLDLDANSHTKGLSLVVSTSMKTGKHRVLGVAYRRNAKDRGLLLNYCPFCGKDIRWHEHHYEEKTGRVP